ncbi:MAG: ABC transporter ATP-binding protein [Arachnia sp.]
MSLLRVRGLTKAFPTTVPPTQVLHGIDLDVAAGEFLAIMGSSGSGKSTLLYAMSGMDTPSGGSVELEGRELTSLTDAEISAVRLTRMGFVFQQAYFLANLSIRDNVLLPALTAASARDGAADRRVDALLERFGVAHVAHHGITEVSGGQLQRASLCRALATEPAILFADEPTGALNSSMTEEVLDALAEAHADGTTVVMVTHDPACAARAERVVYLRDGLIVDERPLGSWSRADADEREATLGAWLRSHGF